jgi:hypothetical protein
MRMAFTQRLDEGDILPIAPTAADKAGRTQKIEVRASAGVPTAGAARVRGKDR